MIPVLEDIAQTLNIDPEILWRESLEAYVTRELRLIELDIADIQDRYNAVSPEQLKASIESGEVYSHPAWEDLIEWENLLVYRQQLAGLQTSIA